MKWYKLFDDNLAYSRREVLEKLQIAEWTFNRLLKNGAIKRTYVGKMSRYFGKQLNDFLASNKKV